MISRLDLPLTILSSSEWLQLLLGVSCKGILILLLAAALVRGLRQAPASVRHLVWSLAVAGLLALPVLEPLMPGWRLPLFPSLQASSAASDKAPIAPAEAVTTNESDDAELLAALAAAATSLPSAEMNQPASEPTIATHTTPAETRSGSLALGQLPPYKMPDFDGTRVAAGNQTMTTDVNWGLALLMVWAWGFLFCIGRMLIGLLRVAQLVRYGQPVTDALWADLTRQLSAQLGLTKRVMLVKSPRIALPLTWGIWRGVVLLPEEADEWTPECKRIVLLHELSHVKRRDCLTQMLAQVACAFHWFNPLAWSAARRLRVERELACDDQVLEAGTRATDYAGCLVEIARAFEKTAFVSPLTVGMACSHLESRVRSILNPDIKRRSLNRRRVIMATVLAFCVIAPLSVIKPWAIVAAHSSENTSQTASSSAEVEQSFAGSPDSRRREQSRTGQHQQTDSEARLIQTALYQVREEMSVQSNADVAIPPNAAITELLQAIAAAVGPASGQEGKGQGKGQGEGKGSNVDAERARRFRDVQIPPEYVESLKRMGFDNLSTNQLIQAHIHNITEEYINQVRSWGYDRLTINQLVRLKVAGVTAEYVARAKAMGFARLSLDQITSMKMNQVTPEFVEEMRQAGFDNLSADQLLGMRHQGINAEFARQAQAFAQSEGFGKLSANELVQVRTFNLTPAFVAEVKAMGFGDLSFRKLVQVRVHGVNPEFLRQMRELGFDNLTLDQAIQMKVHGITPAYVKKMRDAGYKNISLKQLIDYKISGVDEILLKNSR